MRRDTTFDSAEEEEGPEPVRVDAGVSGEQLSAMSPAARAAQRWAAKGGQMAQGVKGSGMSKEDRKARAREYAKRAYERKKAARSGGEQARRCKSRGGRVRRTRKARASAGDGGNVAGVLQNEILLRAGSAVVSVSVDASGACCIRVKPDRS